MTPSTPPPPPSTAPHRCRVHLLAIVPVRCLRAVNSVESSRVHLLSPRRSPRARPQRRPPAAAR
eukprot:6765236-Prymnesium_polylepis.1